MAQSKFIQSVLDAAKGRPKSTQWYKDKIKEFGKPAALDLIRDGIRCNALIIAESYTPAYENWIDTMEHGAEKLQAIQNTIPFETRMTTPQEIADTILFTISDKSSHTTGQFLFVDGGYVHLDRALLPAK